MWQVESLDSPHRAETIVVLSSEDEKKRDAHHLVSLSRWPSSRFNDGTKTFCRIVVLACRYLSVFFSFRMKTRNFLLFFLFVLGSYKQCATQKTYYDRVRVHVSADGGLSTLYVTGTCFRFFFFFFTFSCAVVLKAEK